MDVPENILGKIGRDARLRFMGIIAQNLFFLVTALLISKVLGAGSLGNFILAITVFNILGFASTLGMKFGTLRYVAYHRGRDDMPRVKGTIFSSAVIALIMGGILGGLLFFFSSWIAVRLFHAPGLRTSLRILAFTLPLLSLSTVIISSLQGFKAIKEKVCLENFIQPLFALLLIGVALVAGRSLTAALGAWAASVVFVCLLSLIFLRRVYPFLWSGPLPHFAVKTLLSFSLPLLGVGFLYYLFTRMDILMLGYFKSSTDVGVYAIAARLSVLIAFPLDAVNVIFEPIIAEISGMRQEEKFSALYQMITYRIVVVGFPLFMLLIIFAPPVMALFGKSFTVGISVLVILALGQLINIGVGSAGALLSMTGHSRLNLYNTISMLVLNFILNCILIPRLGIRGAAIATAVSVGLINLLRIGEVRLILHLHPFTLKYLKTVITGAVSCSLVYLMGRFIPLNLTLPGRALIFSIVFVLAYGVGLLFWVLDANDRSALSLIKGRVFSGWK